MSGTDVEVTSDVHINGRPLGMLNWSGIDTETVTSSGNFRELAQELTRWVDTATSRNSGQSLLNRSRYTPPDNPYDEMRAARHAVTNDSVVSGVQEVTEAYAFQGVKWESDNADEADCFNQLSKDLDLDSVLRRMWWDEFSSAQAVCAKVWGWVEYTVRGSTTKGNSRKKKYRFWAPVKIATIDPTKVWPVKEGPVADEQLVWCGSRGDVQRYNQAVEGEVIKPLDVAFYTGIYQPGSAEAAQLSSMGIDPMNMLVMNPVWTFRHTLTKPDYMHHPTVRLKSCFQLLDLKQQLLASDRAMLVGSANYILLIRKGTDQIPGQQAEVDNLRENYSFIAKLPVIISDHRLSIDIIAPKTDLTLNAEKYDLLDQRLLGRLMGTLTVGKAGRGENQSDLSLGVARVMENRRHMLRRTLEREVGRAILDHPKNKGIFDGEPSLVFTPRNIALAMDQQFVQALLALRTQREISRDTILEFFGLDQATEAMRMEIEEAQYDDIFKTQIPFSAPGPGGAPAAPGTPAAPAAPAAGGSPAKAPAKKAAPAAPPLRTGLGPNGTPVAPGVSGGRGGRPAGGGKSPQSPQAVKPKTSKGNPSTGGK